MGVVHKSMGRKFPSSRHLKSEVAIVAELAQAYGRATVQSGIKWTEMSKNYDLIRDNIEQCIFGFENYNVRVRQSGGFYLPNCTRNQHFETDIKKAKFSLCSLPRHALEDGEFVLMTIRSHDQFNTTIYGMDDRYRGVYNERRVVLINPEDMKEEGLSKGDRINLKSNYDGIERLANNFIIVPYKIARGCIASYFPETNVLVPLGLKADKSDTPASKSVKVSLEKTQYT